MAQRIALFDFDGTITTSDTLLEFIKYSKGSFQFYLGFLLNSPWLVAYRLGVISNQAAKERILRWFFRGMPLDAFQALCDRFAATIIPALIRPKAREEMTRLQESGAILVIASASPGNWIRPWTVQPLAPAQITVIATVLEVRDGKITGRIEGRNCHGAEKLRRILEQYTLSDYGEVYAYGDSPGDRPMLQAANVSFYKPFR